MTVRIENQTCFFTTENGKKFVCVTIVTEGAKAMSAEDVNDKRTTSPKQKPMR